MPVLAFPLKSALLAVLVLTVSLASALCEHGKPTAGFFLHVFNKEHCNEKAKDVHHETFTGSRLNVFKNIMDGPCLCLPMPDKIAGNLHSFVFTSGYLMPTSVTFYEGKHCDGKELGFSTENWMDRQVKNTNIHSANVCAVDIAKWLLAIAKDSEE